METPPTLSRLRYSLPEAAALLGVSRATLYNRINYGSLSVVHDGRRVFITSDELQRYAAQSLSRTDV